MNTLYSCANYLAFLCGKFFGLLRQPLFMPDIGCKLFTGLNLRKIKTVNVYLQQVMVSAQVHDAP
ncbi:hypothetical protein EMGBS15_04860 [Filimonas sp.]|jgi:hypothetical protein|nr:hypothetical protein EMGBS15_04860 [Filimonas sp.]